MHANLDGQLLADATLVRDFAIRTGRLPDKALLDAIAAAEGASGPPTDGSIVALAAALNDAIPRIAPVTLVDLRAGRSLFDPAQVKRSAVVQSVLGVIALLLVVAIAYLSYNLHEEVGALSTIQRVNAAHVVDKLNDVRLIAQRGEVFKKAGMELEDYHRRIRELRELYDELNGSNLVLQRFLASATNVTAAASSASPATPASARGDATPSSTTPDAQETERPASATSLRSVEDDKQLQPDKIAAPLASPPPSSTLPETSSAEVLPTDICTPDYADRLLVPFRNSWLAPVLADSLDEYCFSNKLNLSGYTGYGNGYGVQTGDIFRLQSGVVYLTVWVLPFLYGLLGSVVFLMRNELDPRTANLSLMAVILRIVLGGVSGVAIGWFWASAGAEETSRLINSIPFALSFLAGFSIDLLFSFLDRIVKSVHMGSPIPNTGK